MTRNEGRRTAARGVAGFLAVLLAGTLLAVTPPTLADSGDGWVSGEGTCFAVTNSTYLNVTLCSSEVVNVTLESVPDVVSFTIEQVDGVTSTDLTISGFEATTTYYRHQDGYLIENFTTGDGNYSYTQDLSAPRHVFIAEGTSTKYVRDAANGGDCYLIGTWDGPTKTCTLTGPALDVGYKVDTSGDSAYAVGLTEGSFPGQMNAGQSDVFVRKYDAVGNVIWTRQFGTSATEGACGIAADTSGVYAAGSTNGAFPGQTNAGNYDPFVRKYDGDGNALWTRQFGTSSVDYCTDLFVYGSAVYVSGRTEGGTFPGQTSAGGSDAFVRKYDGDGNAIWTRQFGTSSTDEANGVSADASGSYVAGLTCGTLPGQASSGSCDMFVRKYNADGNVVWTRQFGTPAADWANDINVGASGVYVTGPTEGSIPGQTNAGNYDVIVRKYDADGSVVWTRQFGTSSFDRSYAISSDASSVYLGGSTSGTLPGQTSAGGYDAFVRKYDSDGNAVWTKQFGTSATEAAYGASADASGVYVAGFTDGALPGQTSEGGSDAFVRKHDGAGNAVWTRQFGSVGSVNEMIVLDSDGITLDGAGHSVSAPSISYGIYASSRTGLTVKNVQVSGPSYGIALHYSATSTVSGNTISSVGIGVYLYASPSSIVQGNVATVPKPNDLGCSAAIHLLYSGLSTITGNRAEAIAPWYTCYGIRAMGSPGLTIDANIAKAIGSVGSGGSYAFGIYLLDSGSAVITGNTISAFADWGSSAVQMERSGSTEVRGNTVIYPTTNGFSLSASSGSLIADNVISARRMGIALDTSPDSTTSGNVITTTLDDNSPVGVSSSSERVLITGNRVTVYRGTGITAGNSNTVDGNTVTVSPGGGSSKGIVRDGWAQPREKAVLISNNSVIVGTGQGIGLCNCYDRVTDNAISVVSGTGIVGASYVAILRNTVSVSFGSGMSLGSSNEVGWNKISATANGIQMEGGNWVHDNDIRGAQYRGIEQGYWASGNIIENNVVAASGTGISISGEGWSNVVRRNLIADNTLGMVFSFILKNHRVYYNCFLNNTRQLDSYRIDFTGTVWHDGGNNPSQGTPSASPWGNYWSDYHGLDDGTGGRPRGDGVGDTQLPHQRYDSYPLMSPNMPSYGRVCAGNAPPTIVSFTASAVTEGQPTVFTVTATDPENGALTYAYDFDGDGVIDETGPSSTATYTWGDDHAGTARVRVSDGEQAVEASASVTVVNAHPALDVADEVTQVEGQRLDVSFRVTDPGSDDLLVRVGWEDGATEETSFPLGPEPDADESTDVNPRDEIGTFSRVFGDDTTLTATLTATDDDGGIATKLLVVTVVNGEPRVTFADFPSGLEGSAIDFSATAEDPGADDLTFCWDTDDDHTECRTYPHDGTFPFIASDGGTHVWGDDATYDVVLTVTDDGGGSTTWTQPTLVGNVAPTPTLELDGLSYLEGSPVAASAGFADPGSDDVALTWEWGFGPTETRTFLNDGTSPDPAESPWGTYPFSGTDAMSYTYADDGLFPLTLTACDDDEGCAAVTRAVYVENLPPTVEITGPAVGSVYAVGTPVLFTGSFTDPGVEDTHVATWEVDGTTFSGSVVEDGGAGTVVGTYTFTAPGVYRVTLVVVDDDGGWGMANSIGELSAFVVVYDPNGGFVTGGGWIDSPPGAYVPNPLLTGKASFGFVSKYQQGSNVPTGQTEFQFKVADLNFHSTAYDWLVVAGARAQFKGAGTVNGGGDYGFLLTAIDGQLNGGGGADRFRIKIWDRETGTIVYDNQLGADEYGDAATAIGGGSIVIRKG